MSKVLVDEQNLSDIADSIRAKNGTQETYKPSEMSGAIDDLPSGGGDVSEYFTSSIGPGSTNSDYNIIGRTIKKLPSTITLNGTSMARMFLGCENLEQIPNFNTTNVTSMEYAFYDCKAISEIPLFNTSSVTNFSYAFKGCTSLTSIPNIDTSKGTQMGGMFSNCSGLISIPNIDISSATSISSMFGGCSGLTNADLTNFNPKSNCVINNLFRECSNLKSVDLSTWVLAPTAINNMFSNCSKLAVIDISGLSFENVNQTTAMFVNCGTACLQSDGAYSNGIPYVYVKDTTAQDWLISHRNNVGMPSTWTTDNIVVKQ